MNNFILECNFGKVGPLRFVQVVEVEALFRRILAQMAENDVLTKNNVEKIADYFRDNR